MIGFTLEYGSLYGGRVIYSRFRDIMTQYVSTAFQIRERNTKLI